MENLLHNINKGSICFGDLAVSLDVFLMDNSTQDGVVYKHEIFDVCPELKMGRMYTDDFVIYITYFNDEIIDTLFAIKDRLLHINFENMESTFYQLTNKEAFSNLIENLEKNHFCCSFLCEPDLYEEINDVDIHWVTKRYNAKSARGYAEPPTAMGQDP